MRPGFALTIDRSAPLAPGTKASIIAFVAGLFFAAVLAAQAQESVEPEVLPSLAEAPASSAESAPSTSAEPLPALPQSLPPEPLPSSPAPSLPSSEEAFPSSREPLSPSMNSPGGYTPVWPAPPQAGPTAPDSAWLNSFVDTTGQWVNLDAGGPTRVNIFNTRFRADYDLTGKVFLQGEFDSSIYFYPNNISSYMVAGGLYIYYKWLPKVSVGIGGTFGYDWVDDPTTNQTFEQVNARLNYEVTNKFFLYLSGGVEFRQFEGNRSEYTSPVFEGGLIYYPFSGTTLTLAAGRRLYNSVFLP